MDGATRDLERMRERDEGGEARRWALVALATATTIGVALALGTQVSGSANDAEAQADPLARLDPAEGLAPVLPEEEGGHPLAEAAEIDPVALTFPETLSDEDRPEIRVALAAASAELRHPDPLPGSGAIPTLAGPMMIPAADPIQDRLPAALPAALAAGTGGAIARAAPHDPMLLGALPGASVGEAAPEGHDGEYTVQVISYDSAEGAHAFAAGLRARGHRAFVMRADVEGRGTMYRVRIGPFESMAAAASYRRRFEESERMNTIVIRRR